MRHFSSHGVIGTHSGGGGGGGGGGVKLKGDDGANTLNGGAGSDELSGLGGNDLLNAGAGDDKLDGGSGNDTISAGSGSDEITGGLGDDWITSDNSAATRRADVKIDDRAGDNHIDVIGNASARIDVRSGDGADTINLMDADRAEIRSGGGADAITVDGHFNELRLVLGAGTQTVDVGADAELGKARIDRFAAGDAGDVLKIGDWLSSHLSGWDPATNPNAEGYVQLVTDGDHTLLQIDADGGGDGFTSLLRLSGDAAGFTAANFDGLALTVGAGDVYQGDDDGGDHHGTSGDDSLHGGSGDDSLHGDRGSDDLLGGSGDDHLDGGDGDDHLEGGGGADDLSGGKGDDTLEHDGGDDHMGGGKGADDFVFTVADGSTVSLVDYEARKDVINLSAIDADVNAAGDQAFHFVDAFGDAAGEATLSFDAVTNTSTAMFDVNGDGVADLTLNIAGHVSADAGWVL